MLWIVLLLSFLHSEAFYSSIVNNKGVRKQPLQFHHRSHLLKDRRNAVWKLCSQRLDRSATPYENLIVGVTKETTPFESRVAQTPQTVAELVQNNFTVWIERNAGLASNIKNEDYEAVGAKIVSSEDIWKADIVVRCFDNFFEKTKINLFSLF